MRFKVGDIGTVIEVTVQDARVAVDVSTATTKKFVFASRIRRR